MKQNSLGYAWTVVTGFLSLRDALAVSRLNRSARVFVLKVAELHYELEARDSILASLELFQYGRFWSNSAKRHGSFEYFREFSVGPRHQVGLCC